jgi:hypothetical protein
MDTLGAVTDTEQTRTDRERWAEALRRIEGIFAAALDALVDRGVPGIPVVQWQASWHGVTTRLMVVDRHWQLGPVRLDPHGGLHAGDAMPVADCWKERSFYRGGELATFCRKHALRRDSLVAMWSEPETLDLDRAVRSDRLAEHIHAAPDGTPVVKVGDSTATPLAPVVEHAVTTLLAGG